MARKNRWRSANPSNRRLLLSYGRKVVMRSLAPVFLAPVFCTGFSWHQKSKIANVHLLSLALFFIASALIAQVRTPAKPQPDSSPAETKPEDRWVLQGHITDAITGQPVKDANLQLHERAPNGNPRVYSSTSETDGTFAFANIDPGYYNLTVSRSGYAETAYHATLAVPTGAVISIRPGQKLAKIDVSLTPLGVVTGTVLDQNGSPVAMASVAVLASAWLRGKLVHYIQNGARTNDLGQYRIVNVRPGNYYLLVQRVRAAAGSAATPQPEKAEIRPVRTYYPSALTRDAASPLTVKAGQELTAMDIRLRTAATYHIRGRVSGVPPGGATGNLGVNVVLRGEAPAQFLPDVAALTKVHTFDFPGAAPGAYTLWLMSLAGPLKLFARQDVQVGEADLNNVQFVVTPISIQGQITIANTPPSGVAPLDLKSVQISLHGAEPLMNAGYVTSPVNEDGTFALENLAPGRYDVLLGGTASKTYESSVQFADKEIIGQELDLTPGGGQLNVVLRYGPAEVRGTVPELQNKRKGQASSQPDVTVVLTADTAPEDFYGIRMIAPNYDGSFGMTNVPPRHYRAYAIEKLDRAQLQNPDVLKELQSKGTEVDLDENDKKQIEAPLVTAEQMQEIYAKLGIEVPQESNLFNEFN